MAKRSRSSEQAPARRPAARLRNEVLVELLDTTRERLANARGELAAKYAAALAELELEAVSRGLTLSAGDTVPEPRMRATVHRPEDDIPRIPLVLNTGSQLQVLELLEQLEPSDLYHVWPVANAIPAADLRVARLTALCLVLDRRVFGEEVAEQRHRSYALFPGSVVTRLALVNDAIAATFVLLHLRPAS